MWKVTATSLRASGCSWKALHSMLDFHEDLRFHPTTPQRLNGKNVGKGCIKFKTNFICMLLDLPLYIELKSKNWLKSPSNLPLSPSSSSQGLVLSHTQTPFLFPFYSNYCLITLFFLISSTLCFPLSQKTSSLSGNPPPNSSIAPLPIYLPSLMTYFPLRPAHISFLLSFKFGFFHIPSKLLLCIFIVIAGRASSWTKLTINMFQWHTPVSIKRLKYCLNRTVWLWELDQ